MPEWLYYILLGVVQGITEFLPVSSSAHLVLFPKFFGHVYQGVLIDVMAHFGTLAAVMLYFRGEVKTLIIGLWHAITDQQSKQRWLFGRLVAATIPMVIGGGIMHVTGWSNSLRTIPIIATATLVFGILLGIADWKCKRGKAIKHLGWKEVILLGLAQVLALIPGTSRSGITMTMGRFLKMGRREAARFSMLMAMPVILIASIVSGWQITMDMNPHITTQACIVAGSAFLTALASIHLLLKWLEKSGFWPFVIYRVALSAALFGWVFIA